MSKEVRNRLNDITRPTDEFPRRMLPDDIDLGDWSQLEGVFKELTDRPLEAPADLERWVLDVSEVFAAVAEEGSRRRIAMTCATDDEAAEKAFLQFVEDIQPKLRQVSFDLDKKLTESKPLEYLPKDRYEVLVRNSRTRVEIFRKENIPLATELTKLSQQYQKVCGAMTVAFRDKEHTLQQMAPYLEETDRQLRQDAWTAVAERRLQDRDKLEELFDSMVDLRQTVARNADFDNYMEYRFRDLERFDYTPADCVMFHQAVEELVVPVYRKVLKQRAQRMELDALRPWDLSVDVFGRPPLKPFADATRLVSGCHNIFNKVDPSLADKFKLMIDRGLLDLDSRKGKAPGGYQSTLSETRLPFIFMNAVGLNRDVFTLLHEGGHAFHALLARDEPILEYRHAPMEFCEVASMSMELIGAEHLEEFYNPAEAARARRKSLEEIVGILPWIATIDAFQHWIYTNPNHSRDQRAGVWLNLHERFGPVVDYSGFEENLKYGWHRQLHLFEVPFYYIEYGIAELGALQVWVRAQDDTAAAVADYQKALALGGSRPLPELFDAAGIRFDFSAATIKPLMDQLMAELDRLAAQEEQGQ